VFLTIYLVIPEKFKDSSQKRLHPLCFAPSNSLFTTYHTNQHFTTYATGGERDKKNTHTSFKMDVTSHGSLIQVY